MMRQLFHPDAESGDSGEIREVDPKTILFSVPTLANELPPLEPATAEPDGPYCYFHEDDWLQIELLPRETVNGVQSLVSEFKAFEEHHRTESGWRNVFVRHHTFSEDLPSRFTLDAISEKFAPALMGELYLISSGYAMRVVGGFSFELEDKVWLYGHAVDGAVQSLGFAIGAENAHNTMVETFDKLSTISPLILVDWRAMLIVIEPERGSYRVWQA